MNMEESFPRGKEGLTSVPRSNKAEDLFKSTRPVSSKKKRKNVLTGEEEELLAGKKKKKERDFLIQHLSYDSMCEGLLSLGRVHFVRDHEVLVSLPGRTIGSVSIKAVSRPYTKALEALAASTFPSDEVIHSLKGMFRQGDLIIVKVIGVTEGDKGHRISLSTDPAHVQANWNATLLKSGMVVTGAVESREEHGYVMDLGINGVKAFLPHERCTGFIKTVNGAEPIGVGQLMQVKVINCKIHRLMATVTLSAIPKEIGKVKMEDEMELNYNTLLPGMHVDGIVMNTHKTGMQVHSLGLKALVHQDHLDDTWSTPSKFQIGATLTARILYLEPNGSSPYLSLQPNFWPYGPFRQSKKDSTIILGSLEKVRIVRFEKRGLVIRFEGGEKGIVTMQRCSDDLSWTEDDIAKHFPVGTFHECRVLDFSPLDYVYIGSFQRSMIKQDLVKMEQVTPGQKVDCEIISWNNGGATVQFGYNLKAFVPNLHFGEVVVRNPMDKYPVGSKVKGRVFLVDMEKQNTLITLKKRLVRSDGFVISKYDEVKVGMRGHGVIRSVLAAGLQISTIGGLLGFLPASKISKEKMGNLKDVFHPGQTIEYKVHEINVERKQLILSLYVASMDDGEIEVKPEQDEEPKRKKSKLEKGVKSVEEPSDSKKKKKKKNKNKDTEEMMEIDEVKIEENGEEEGTKKKKSSKKDLQAAKKSLLEKKKEKLTKKDKVKNKLKQAAETKSNGVLISTEESSKSFWEDTGVKEEEDDDVVDENAGRTVLAKNKVGVNTAMNADEHESRVAKMPNEPNLWIDYMAFALESQDVNKAREIAHRGINLMGFREEKAKLKVLSALLNIECKYGSEESLKKVLEEGERSNDKFSVLKQMALIYDRNNKYQEAEKIYKRIVGSFRTSSEAWIRFGVFYFHHSKAKEGRELFRRALEALPATEHIPLITKFAGLELEHGDEAKGRTMLDQTVATHPKRMDLWLLYANLLIKQKKYDDARSVLNRGLDTKLAPKKMKPLLKSFLDLELKFGTPETLAKFKERAVNYLDKVELGIPA